MAIDVGASGYKGQGAVATNISYTTPNGIVLSTGVSYAGSGAAIVRVGVGFRIKLGIPSAAPVAADSAPPVPVATAK